MTLRVTFVLFFILVSYSNTSFSEWKEHSTSAEQTKILKKIENLVAQVDRPVVIFDLDSTLYKNHQRWEVIIREFGEENGIDNLKKFNKEQISDSWDMKRILKVDAKLDDQLVQKILPEFKDFWAKRFFHDDYMKYDETLPGSVKFVTKLYKDGAFIVYITGRDAPHMKKGTMARLKADGFPLGIERTQLIMKPQSNSDLKNQTKSRKKYVALIEKTDKEFKSGAIAKAQVHGMLRREVHLQPP